MFQTKQNLTLSWKAYSFFKPVQIDCKNRFFAWNILKVKRMDKTETYIQVPDLSSRHLNFMIDMMLLCDWALVVVRWYRELLNSQVVGDIELQSKSDYYKRNLRKGNPAAEPKYCHTVLGEQTVFDVPHIRKMTRLMSCGHDSHVSKSSVQGGVFMFLSIISIHLDSKRGLITVISQLSLCTDLVYEISKNNRKTVMGGGGTHPQKN